MEKHAASDVIIGAHVSAAGGIHKAVERAVGIGASAVQVFSASPRSWRRPEPSALIETVAKAKHAQAQFGINPVATHAMYLVNLASTDPEQLAKSRAVIQFDLEFDARIEGAGVVVHLGSHLGRGWEAVRTEVAEQIAMILKNAPESAHFLIENSAGQNGKLSSDLAEIRWLLDEIKDSRLGWCLDTCHAFAAGYSLAADSLTSETAPLTPAKTANIRPQTLLKTIDHYNLWSDLHVIHVNDSKDPFGSGRDRHENIGDGTIPTSHLRDFLHDARVRTKPLILEVPGLDGAGPDATNITRLKSLV